MSKHTVDLVIADRGWIMEQLARSLAAGLKDFDCRLTNVPSHQADLVYFFPYSIQQPVSRGRTVSFFTHQELVEPARSKFIENARAADFCICMADRYEQVLRTAGIDHVQTIVPGIDLANFPARLRVGVVGRTYHTGRKGEALVARLQQEPWLDFQFTGSGWPKPAIRLQDHELPAFYAGLDCLLVPASIEGGPMPALEALACGCEVVAPDVGFMNRLPHRPYETNNAESALQALRELYDAKLERRNAVAANTRERYVEEHDALFKRLLADRVAAPRQPSISLIKHGTESRTQGGPTIRMRLIAEALTEAGWQANEISFSKDDPAQPDCVHVFNSWPLQTAEASLSHFKARNAKLVYSPIALDLRYLDVYANVLPAALAAESPDLQQLAALLEAAPPAGNCEGEQDPGTLAEGVPGHFAALRRTCALADRVISLSDQEQRFLGAIGVNAEKIVQVKNGVDTSLMREADAELFKTTYRLDRFVLCVGRIEPRKNQAVLALALQQLDVPLVFIGHVGDDRYFQLVKQHAGPTALFLDRIEDRRLLASAYRGAALTVLTSWCEGAPLAAIEAGAAGSPLLLSTMSGEQEYFGAFAQYVHPLDLAQTRDLTQQALDQPESAAERLRRSQWVCQQFDVRLHAARTREVYQQAMAAKPAAGPLYIDITHLAHAIASGRNNTGMPKLEAHLFEELRQSSTARYLVWNSALDVHLLIPDDELDRIHEFATTAELPCAHPATERVLSAPDPHRSKPEHWNYGRKRLALTLGKYAISKAPAALEPVLLGTVRRLKPNFNPTVDPEHRLTLRTAFSGLAGLAPAQPQGSDAPPPPQRTLKTVPRPLALPDRSRVVITGQPWISNDRYLRAVERLVAESGCRLSAIIPDVIYYTHPESFAPATATTYKSRLLRLLAITDRALAISAETATAIQAITERQPTSVQVQTMRLGSPTISERTLSIRGLRGEKFVLYVASINPRKNHRNLLQAWEIARSSPALAKVKLVLAGANQLPRGELDAILAGHQDGVHVTGSISDEEIAWLYRNCLFTVYPSKYEGWGFPVEESVSCGKVCVASDTVPAAQDLKGVLKLDPNDIFQWVDALQSLIHNSALREALEQQTTALSKSSWQDAIHPIVGN